MFLQLRPDTVQGGCGYSVHLSKVFFERLAPAKIDHRPNDHDVHQ